MMKKTKKVKKGLIYKPSNYIYTNENLRKNWEEELSKDLEENESLDDLKEKVPFEKWKQDLIDTGEYEETVYFEEDNISTQSEDENEEEDEL